MRVVMTQINAYLEIKKKGKGGRKRREKRDKEKKHNKKAFFFVDFFQ